MILITQWGEGAEWNTVPGTHFVAAFLLRSELSGRFAMERIICSLGPRLWGKVGRGIQRVGRFLHTCNVSSNIGFIFDG